MKKLQNKIIRLSGKKFERILTFWFIVFVIIALFVWIIEEIVGSSHSPQVYDLVYFGACVYGYISTLFRLEEMM